ncbi:unnamed protein product [Lampetra planeri]
MYFSEAPLQMLTHETAPAKARHREEVHGGDFKTSGLEAESGSQLAEFVRNSGGLDDGAAWDGRNEEGARLKRRWAERAVGVGRGTLLARRQEATRAVFAGLSLGFDGVKALRSRGRRIRRRREEAAAAGIDTSIGNALALESGRRGARLSATRS